MATRHTLRFLQLGLLGLVPACNAVPAYFVGFEQLRVGAAELADEDAAHPVIGAFVQTEYWLDFGAPPPDELAALQPAGADPVDMTPWVSRDDVEVSIAYRLTNESDATLRAFVLVDGATEFYDWNPVAMFGMGGGEDADEIAFPSLLGFFPLELEAGEVLVGEFREDDMAEAMLDLDILTRFCGGPFALLYNRSEVDPVGTQGVPAGAPLAAMAMIRLTLGANAPATLDYSIRVRDKDDVLYDGFTDDARYEVAPTPYVPAGFAQVPAGQMDPGVMSEYCMGMAMP